MDPQPFKLDKNEFYIACYRPFKLPNGNYSGLIAVYELLRPQKHNMLTNMDWSFEPEIIDPRSTNGYNSLQIDGHPVDYNKLVQALCISRLRVNRLGYCYFQLREGVAYTMETYGFAFYRMNDIWNWSDYGINVDPNSYNFARMNWDRLDILYGGKLARFPHSNDLLIKCALENQRLKDRVTKLEAELEKSESDENQRLKDQVTKLQAELENSGSENRRLKDQVTKLQAELEENSGGTENERLGDQLTNPQAEVKTVRAVKKHNPQAELKSEVKTPVPSTLFVIKRMPGVAKAITHWNILADNGSNRFEIYLTPSNKCVTDGEVAAAYKSVVFRMGDGVVFDTENWYAIGVKELTSPILIYEGSAFSVKVAGFEVSVPMCGTDMFSYNCDDDNLPGQRPFIFGIIILPNHHTTFARMAIKLLY